MSFIFAVTIRQYMKAARSSPRLDPAKSQDVRPRVTPRSARSAALFVTQPRPSSRKSLKASQRSLLNMYLIALAKGLCFDIVPGSARFQSCRFSTRSRTSRCRASRRGVASRPLIWRSMSKLASIFFTAASATGNMSCVGFFLRTCPLMSAPVPQHDLQLYISDGLSRR